MENIRKYLIFVLPFLLFTVCNATLFGKLHWRGDEKTSSSQLTILKQPESVSFAKDAEAIDASDIPKVISLSFGIPTAKDLSWNGLLVGDIFNRPKAALYFMVDGVSDGSAFKFNGDAMFDVKANSESPVSDLVTVAEGEAITTHVHAAYGNGPFSVSASADENVAMTSYNPSGDNYFYSSKNNGWMLLNDKFVNGQLVLYKAKIIDDISDLFYGQAATFDEQKLTVSHKGQIVFDLNKKEDFMLFAEMKLVESVLLKLSTHAEIVADAYPDLYLFSLSSVKTIFSKYGAASPQGKLARSIVTSFMNKVTDKFAQLYGGNMIALAVTLGVTQSNLPDSEVRSVYHHLRSQLGVQDFSTFEKNLPELHILKDLEESAKSTLCNSLKNTLSGVNKNIKLSCLHHNKAPRITKRSILAAKADAFDPNNINLGSMYSSDFPVIFNIWLWLLILLFLIVYVVSLMMWYMDPGRDSIIYRMTSQRIKTD